jgi:hypothetical protein
MVIPVVSGKSADAGHEGLQLEICVSCPQCGGENSWDLKEHLHKCRFCSSVLYWPQEKKNETRLVAEDRLASSESILETLAFAEATKARAQMIGNLISGVEESRRDVARLQAEERVPPVHDLMLKIMPQIRVDESFGIHVPYRVLQVTLVFYALGRALGRKMYRPLFFLLEDVLPAYGKEFNFRDKGLWFSRTVLRPLTPEMLASGNFVVPKDDELDRQEVLKHYLRRTELLKADMEPISFDSEAILWKEWTVFRPFRLVLARTPSEAGWFLLDGQFATIAGRPDDCEAEFLSSASWAKLEKEVARLPEIKAIPFRCPTCGSDITLDPSALYQLCRECGRMLEPKPDGLKEVEYKTLELADVPWRKPSDSARTAWLPYWTVRVEWLAKEETGKDPLGLAPLVLGTRPGSVPETPSCGRLLYIPAFDGWTCDQYDDWAFETASSLTSSGGEPFDARLMVQADVGKEDSVIPVSVEGTLASGLFPKIIPFFFPPEAQTRLNPLLLGQLFKSVFSFEMPSLVYVPVPCSAGSCGEILMTGPRGTVGLSLLKERKWPPILCRTVRRRLEM